MQLLGSYLFTHDSWLMAWIGYEGRCNKDRDDFTWKSLYSNLYKNAVSWKLFVESWLMSHGFNWIWKCIYTTKIVMTLFVKFGIQICRETQLLGSYLLTHDSKLQLDACNKDRNDSNCKSQYSNLYRNAASWKLFVDSWLMSHGFNWIWRCMKQR